MLIPYTAVRRVFAREGLKETSLYTFRYAEDGEERVFTPEPNPEGNIDTDDLLYGIGCWDTSLSERLRTKLAEDLGELPENL